MTHLPKARKRKRRVAGYARVSTDSDEQFTSYQSQVNYHTKMIEANAGRNSSGSTPTRASPVRSPRTASGSIR